MKTKIAGYAMSRKSTGWMGEEVGDAETEERRSGMEQEEKKEEKKEKHEEKKTPSNGSLTD